MGLRPALGGAWALGHLTSGDPRPRLLARCAARAPAMTLRCRAHRAVVTIPVTLRVGRCVLTRGYARFLPSRSEPAASVRGPERQGAARCFLSGGPSARGVAGPHPGTIPVKVRARVWSSFAEFLDAVERTAPRANRFTPVSRVGRTGLAPPNTKGYPRGVRRPESDGSLAKSRYTRPQQRS